MPKKKINQMDNIKYVNIQSVENLPIIRLSSKDDFLKLAKESKSKTVFVREYDYKTNEREIKGLTEFITHCDWIGYVIPGYGYTKIQDIVRGSKLGFSGKSKKFRFDEDHMVKESGYGAEISDGYLYHHVMELGYSDYSEFEKAFDGGFYSEKMPLKEFRGALKKGFSEYEKYKEFKKSGFNDSREYIKAVELQIDNYELYRIYLVLNKLSESLGIKGFDQILLYSVIGSSKLKSLTLKQITELFLDISSELLRDYSNEAYPDWYIHTYEEILDDPAIERDLSNNSAFRGLGTYDKEEQIFYKFLSVPLFVDGSNVAYNNQDSSRGAKPLAKHIKSVLNEARELGFSDIRIYHDANLEYLVEDKEILEEIRKENKVEKVPARTRADDFIISFAKKHSGFIVTCDQFRDYLKRHPEDMEFINFHRLAFMIDDDGEVIFSNQDQVAEIPAITTTMIEELWSSLKIYGQNRDRNEKAHRKISLF